MNNEFKQACEKASEILKDRPGYRPVAPTKRQYRKWCRKTGTAYQFGRQQAQVA